MTFPFSNNKGVAFFDTRCGKSRLKTTFQQTRVKKYPSTLEIGLFKVMLGVS